MIDCLQGKNNNSLQIGINSDFFLKKPY